ncbi:MAG: hypothetical protein AB1403_24415, partial [Candidatus Riflebacteria bacterium]
SFETGFTKKQNNRKKLLKQGEVELSISLDIKNEDDYRKAEDKLDELNDYLEIVDDKTRPILEDAIDQLENAIWEYESDIDSDEAWEKEVDRGYDPFEGTIYDAADFLHLRIKARIVYEDRDGNETLRDIDVTGFGTAGNGKAVYAYCHLRNANRTFIIKNIKEFIDLETGEVIEYILPYLEKKYQASPRKSFDDFMKKHSNIMEILFYVGKADTQLRREERVIICNAVRRIGKDDRITDEMINEVMDRMYPISERTFKVRIGRMSDYTQDIKRDIIETMSAIVNTQKTIHPSEQTALDYATKKLGI